MVHQIFDSSLWFFLLVNAIFEEKSDIKLDCTLDGDSNYMHNQFFL